MTLSLTVLTKQRIVILLISVICFTASCKSIHGIERIPDDTYLFSPRQYASLDTLATAPSGSNNKIKADVEQTDSLLKVVPHDEKLNAITISLDKATHVKMYRNTFDIDVLTVPFKVRPSVKGFPEQLNANFDAALYLGRRRDNYSIETTRSHRGSKTRITGVGYGYGGFVGIGSVTMNSYVTRQAIDYEYDGFVLNGGFAGIYDAKRFNLGLAIGADFLVDKNRSNWIYQGKPWIGVLFGINLN